MVTASGEFLTASETENVDLFWGLRGGGGNFGIATSFEYQLYSVSTVLGGMILYPFDQAEERPGQFYRDFIKSSPDELNTMGVLLTTPDAVPAAAIAVCYHGDLSKGEQHLKPLRTFGTPLADGIGPMAYGGLQTMLDEGARNQYAATTSNPVL